MVRKRWFFYSIPAALLLLLSSCSTVTISPASIPSALDPHSPDAARLATLWWVMLAFGAAVFVLVLVLLFAGIFHRRHVTSATPPDSHGGDTGSRWVILGGIILPLIIIAIIFGSSVSTLAQAAYSNNQGAMKVHIVARRWWWEVSYPGLGITTANEIHIPVGTPVEVELETEDVIHSFWVPQLNGKMDAIPREKNHLVLQADSPGIYHGQCAEFCGLQHAHMGFLVVAQSKEDLNSWIKAQQQPAATPSDPQAQRGQQVFLSAGCVFCHTVQGLDDKQIDRSSVDLGPDLTHIASRLAIAGASLTNNQGNLAGWIVDAQHVKPGSLMPNMQLTSEELHAVLAYLATLR